MVPLVAGGADYLAVKVILPAQKLVMLLSNTAALGAVLLLVGVVPWPAVHTVMHLRVVGSQLARAWPAGSISGSS